MPPIRLLTPSFKLKKSGAVVFSQSGDLLGQIVGQKGVYIWSTQKREIVSNFKVLTNDCDIAFSPDDQIVAVKNTNGELAFVDIATGGVLSSTGKYKAYREGCQPQFLREKMLLLDGDWKGTLRLFDPMNSKEVEAHSFAGNYMITNVVSSSAKRRFAVAINAITGQPGGSLVLIYDEPIRLNNPQILPPLTADQKHDGGWRSIEKIALHPSGDKIAIALRLRGQNPSDLNTIEIVDLSKASSHTIQLPSRKHSVHGLSWSASNILCASVHENTYHEGQSTSEWRRIRESGVYEHVCIYTETCNAPLMQWPWCQAYGVAFSPLDNALAVASYDKAGAYMTNKSLLSIGLSFGNMDCP